MQFLLESVVVLENVFLDACKNHYVGRLHSHHATQLSSAPTKNLHTTADSRTVLETQIYRASFRGVGECRGEVFV